MPNYKMTRKLILFLTIVISACGQKSENGTKLVLEKNVQLSNDSAQTFSITKVAETDFINAQKTYTNNILYDTIQNKKNGGIIKLPIENKSQPIIYFKDTLPKTDETENKEFEYIGLLKKIGLYIVVANYYETGEVFLINKRTGKKTAAWNIPKSSPHDTYIANLSAGYGMEGVPNGLQVWRIDHKTESISQFLELDQLVWVPMEFVWETEKSLILKVISVEALTSGKPNSADYYYLRLKI